MSFHHELNHINTNFKDHNNLLVSIVIVFVFFINCMFFIYLFYIALEGV